jgi:hypothetical protein
LIDGYFGMGNADGVVVGEIDEELGDVDVAVTDDTNEELNDADVGVADKTDELIGINVAAAGETDEIGDVDVVTADEVDEGLGDVAVDDELTILDGVDTITVDELWLEVVLVSIVDELLPASKDEVATAPVNAAVNEPTTVLEPLAATPSSLPARILSSLNGRPSPNFG